MKDMEKNMQCEIRTQPSDVGVEMTGVVWSDNKATGSFDFIVNKEGPGGSSHVVQRGLFAVEPHQPEIVGTIRVNTSSGDRYLARLTITGADGSETICSAILS